MRTEILLHPRHEHRLLAGMLLALHLALWWDFGGAVSRGLILAHLGVFLLWQPVWSRERRLNRVSGLVFVVATLVFVASMSWWVITFWLVLLTGFVGSRVTVDRRDRYAYLLAMVFLVIEILVVCVPQMAAIHFLNREIRILFSYGLLAVPVGLALIPAEHGPHRRVQGADFLYGLTASLLTVLLALGSLLNMYLRGVDYPVSVVQTILSIAAFLLVVSWLWMPLAGFSGLGQLWQRYLQNIGTPFEQWLTRLAQLARGQQTPERFLDSAMEQLVELPWVSGVDWEGDGLAGTRGEISSPYRFEARVEGIAVQVHTYRTPGTALLLHGRLLVQLVGHFYRAKQRERELTDQAHIRAIHETGARITHDIKNLLQSLHTLTVALQSADEREAVEVQRLLERQLPHLTQRLQMALDKLQAPDRDSPAEEVALRTWWEACQARHAGNGIRFEGRVEGDPVVPADLLDSVIDNLLENARGKRQSEPEIDIRVRLDAGPEQVRLAVSDDGSPVDPAVAERLFKAPVSSRSGLGVGLYQAAHLAQRLGWRLSLANGPEPVRFELTRG
jgi:signal transduction histidine kinase